MAIKKPAENTPTVAAPAPARPMLMKSGTEASEAFSATSTIVPEPEPAVYDIEHVPVKNDPRTWSPLRKNAILALISSASMIAGLAANIQNPAVEEMENDLPATSSQFSLSISMFIFIQGVMPLLWSAISEVKGRKLVYLVSLALFTLGTIVVALSPNISLVIGFRCVQAAGSSAVLSIGAATLVDIFEPAERGSKMGIYYIAPLLGPAIGPIFGGVLTSVWGWRSIFWFLAIVSGASFLAFILFFHDTFRSERSLTYQNVLKQRLRTAALLPLSRPKGSDRNNSTIGKGCLQANRSDVDIERSAAEKASISDEAQRQAIAAALPTIKLSLTDVNPFKPLRLVLRRMNNLTVLFASGLLYAFSFLVMYTMSRTLAELYHYSPLKIGFVTLSFGAGNVVGSLFGGRWSDHELARLKGLNGGKSYPEMRLKSTIVGACLLPPVAIALGWASQQVLHISVICILLFLSGFASIWIYSSTLAYIVDANVGRSSVAVAANSAFRGVSAFVATEMAVPLQDGLGDGFMFTIWGVVMALSGGLILLIGYKGLQWRQAAESREAEEASKLDSATTKPKS